MDHPRMHRPDTVRSNRVEFEAEESADLPAPVGARHDLDLTLQRKILQRGQEQIRGRFIQVQRDIRGVTLPDKLPEAVHARPKTCSREYEPLRFHGRADIRIAEGEGEIRPPDNPLLKSLRPGNLALRNPIRGRPDRDRKGTLGVEVFGRERAPEIRGERDPLLVDTGDRMDDRTVLPLVAPDPQDQKTVAARAEPLDPELRGRRIIQPFQVADGRTRLVDHAELHPVVIRGTNKRRPRLRPVIYAVVQAEDGAIRFRDRRMLRPVVLRTGGKKYAPPQNY